MDVYVESNFVLELALSQEQHESCERIVELCEANNARLILPAYSLVEPYETMGRYAKERTRVSNELATQMKQLARSKPYHNEIDALQEVSGFLARSLEKDKDRLRDTIKRLLAVANIIPLEAPTLLSAIKHQLDHDFSVQDSVVYAAVLSHLSASTAMAKCFLNRNSKDFDDPDIEEALRVYGCKMLFSFEHGHRYILNQIGV
jgi:PIN domain-containing protein